LAFNRAKKKHPTVRSSAAKYQSQCQLKIKESTLWHVYAGDLSELPARKAKRARKNDMHATNIGTDGPRVGLDAG